MSQTTGNATNKVEERLTYAVLVAKQKFGNKATITEVLAIYKLIKEEENEN